MKREKTATQADLIRMSDLITYLSTVRDGKWTSMEQVTDSIRWYPAFFRTSYHNSTARRMLTADIEFINESDFFDRIIISGRKGIKIANENDLGKFLAAELAEVFKKLRRLRCIARKASHDQQITMEGKIRQVFLEEQ